MDFIGDFLTVIRNASKAKKVNCIFKWSKACESIALILKQEGFVKSYIVQEKENNKKFIKIDLKYVNNEPALVGLQRHSSPGCRLYYGHQEIPKVLGGLGISILNTSKGVMNDRNARKLQHGGEVICKVW